MMSPRAITVSVAIILLVACAGSNDDSRPEPGGVVPEDACGASRVQDFADRKLDDALRTRIAEQSGAETIRVMRPGRAYTMEYRAERLSVRIDEDGRIAALNCG